MRKRIIALFLVLCIMLSGCSAMLEDYISVRLGPSFSEFTYTRPDITRLDATLEQCSYHIENNAEFSQIVDDIDALYTLYDSFYTNLNLADIHYCQDMRDTKWAEEYNYCMGIAGEVDAKLEELYEMLAASQYRQELESDYYFGEGFFDSYTGEPMLDEAYIALALEESRLQGAYYDVFAEAGDMNTYSSEFYQTYGLELVQILVDLIRVRQQIAEHFGYESYGEMSYQSIYGREYSAQEAKQYMQNIGTALTDVYDAVYYDEVWQYGSEECSPDETFQYVQKTAMYLGGDVQNAFAAMNTRDLYDLSYSPYKYDGSFCVYLTDYQTPYVFVNPWYAVSDKLSFAHEFGHFTNEYLCSGSYVSTDVSEVQSQAMEYFSLCCAEDEKLTQYKLADSLDVYIRQSAYGLFELEIYELEDEDLTAENLIACYRRISEEFAIAQDDWHQLEFVNVNHFYESPMYIISYVVSNDLAMQLYEMELRQTGKGKKKFEEILSSEDAYILEFAQQYDLKDPFSEERIKEVKTFFDDIFAVKSQAA